MRALASYKDAKSVVALSKSPLFHHQYSSVSKAVAGLADDERKLKRVRKLFQAQWLKYFPVQAVNYLQTDVVNIFREYAPCLRDRQYRHKANCVIGSNKALGIGYGLSLVNRADFASGWSLPLALQRVKSSEDERLVAVEQIREVCAREEFAEALQVNAADNHYGVAEYLAAVNEIGNLVSVVRLRHAIKIYQSEARPTRGAAQVYGAQYRLIEQSGEKQYRRKDRCFNKYLRSIYEKEADEQTSVGKTTRRGKRLRVELRRWRELKLRSKRGVSMKEVELEVVGIRVLEEATGERVFTQDVFVAVVGAERARLSLEEVAEVFYRRFDLEVTNRLMKQQLFLEGYQTPDVQHLDNWTLVVQAAMWLLWAGSEEVGEGSEKWQRYSEPKAAGVRKTAAQTRKGLEEHILSFEQERYRPKKCKKGRGRKKGARQKPRKQYEVVKKGQAEVEIVKTSPQRE